ncbi:MAG: potassium channel protein, partial [Methanobacteriales archaeon]|nr:potassium channel protein [Methanobacteriales archaeon]
IIAIRRGESWIYGPDRNTVLVEGDTLIAKGNEAGAELLRKLAKNEMSLDEL